MDISVLISTRDRARLLEQTLTALARQQFPQDRWEVLVVDNGSVDDTAKVLSRFRCSLPLVTLAEAQPGKNRALNRSLKVAKGDLLVFTDDDVIPVPEWLAEFCAAAGRWEEYGILGARIISRFEVPPPSWLPQHPFAPKAFATFAPNQSEGPLPPGVRPFGPNLAIRRRALAGSTFDESIGPKGKDYPMGSEVELIQRLFDRGERAVYVPGASVEHFVSAQQLQFESLFDRAFRAGRGDIRLKHTARPPRISRHDRLYLWRKVATSWLRLRLRRSGAGPEYFDAGIQFHRARGRFFEAQLISAAARWQ